MKLIAIIACVLVIGVECSQTYYYNKNTNETRWEFPQGVDVKMLDENGETFYYDVETNKTSRDHPEWHEYYAGDHDHPFFVNKETGERSWTLPDDIEWCAHSE